LVSGNFNTYLHFAGSGVMGNVGQSLLAYPVKAAPGPGGELGKITTHVKIDLQIIGLANANSLFPQIEDKFISR
jgi:hypothetical protein